MEIDVATAVYEVGRNGVTTPLVSGWNSTTLSYPFLVGRLIGAPCHSIWGAPYNIHNEGKLLKGNRCMSHSEKSLYDQPKQDIIL